MFRNSEESLTFAESAARLGVWDFDLRTKAMGTSRESFLPCDLPRGHSPRTWQDALELVHPDDREWFGALIRHSLEQTHEWNAEYRVLWPDGSVHWLLGKGTVIVDDSGQPVRISCVNFDITEHKQAEAALRERETRYKEVFDTTSDSIFLLDVTSDGRFKFAGFNAAGEKAVGFSNAEVCGRFIEDVVVDEVANGVIAHYRRCLEAGALINYDEELNLPIGRRYFHTKLIPMRNAVGMIHRILGVARDVTEQKRTEEALRTIEQRLELAQMAAGIGTWDWDIGANKTYYSKEHGPLYGLPSNVALTTEQWLELVHPEDRARIREELNRALDGTADYNTEFRVIWPDGTIHWLLGKGQVFRDSGGKPIRMLGVNMEISERKYAEAALRESEERFRNVADTAPVMIWMSGPDKLCTFFNKGWLAFTGRTMEQDLGNGWSEMVHPDDRDRCWASYSSAFDACRNFQIEYRLRRADGQYRWVLDRGLPRFAPGGVFAGYIGSCMDITELRQAQEEALARQKLESIGVLAGGIAHDFNNLLGTILADAEVAESELSAGSSPTEEIQRIKNVAIRAAEIVRELMIYAGQDEANLELLSISRLMEEMLELLKVSISKRVSLETDLEKDLPAVRGSATQIRQILMNLILNASEAIGQPDGVIKVTTSRVAGYTALALNRGTKLPDGDYVRLEVSDNGCGMTEDTKAKIFDPFFTTKFAGRGLGLAVVQGIIRAHSGAINVISAPGQGTRFQILFPSANKPVAQDRVGDAVSADRIPSNAVTVLVVEDEDTLRLAVSNMLRKKGFCIIEARDGSAAINLLHKHQDGIDVALLDLTIPGNSICEVIAEAGRLRPDIKIILTTAYTRDAVGQCRDAPQVRGFIRKPYRLADLVQLLRRTASS